MESVFFLSQVDFNNKSDGVFKKTISQIEAFDKLGFRVVYFDYSSFLICDYLNKSKEQPYLAKGLIRRSVYWKTAHNYINKTPSFNYAFIRYSFFDINVFKTIKLLQKKGTKIILEIPTYPIIFSKLILKEKCLYLIDSFFRNRVSKYIYRLVYIGDKHDFIFGKKAFRICNGFPTDLLRIEKTGFNYIGNVVNLISVSCMSESHGYERIIEGLHLYYLNHPKAKVLVKLHLVGDGRCKKRYYDLVSKYNLEEYVFFYGRLFGEKLTELYSIATLGLGSFGLFKSGLNEISSLKNKEYMIRGLPFVNGGKEIDVPDIFPYQLTVPNNKEPVNIDSFVKFVSYLEKIGKKKIMNEMNSFAIDNFSWEKIIKKIL